MYVCLVLCVKCVVCVYFPFSPMFLPVHSLCSLAGVCVFDICTFILTPNHIKVLSMQCRVEHVLLQI